jgi:hypothetical protein
MMDAVAERILGIVVGGVVLNVLIMLGSLVLNWKLFAYRLQKVEEAAEHTANQLARMQVVCAATHKRGIEA